MPSITLSNEIPHNFIFSLSIRNTPLAAIPVAPAGAVQFAVAYIMIIIMNLIFKFPNGEKEKTHSGKILHSAQCPP
jgi:hypothetical protein